MMKNAFYFTSKARFVIKIFKLCLEFLVMKQNGFIRKIGLISNFMTSRPGKQTIVIHTLSNISRSKGNVSNISRSKGNETMTFAQLIECNMRKIFVEKPFQNCGGETSPRPFSEKLKLIISLNQ